MGIAAMAVSAVDIALWDLAARLHDLSLCALLGRVHDEVPVYGSGGFCSYSLDRLAEQLGGWAARGIGRVKMKVGRVPSSDRERLRVARDAIGADVDLFVDANGAFAPKEALRWADVYAGFDVRDLEEPVSSDDLAGLRLLRDRCPAGMAIAAGEYGYDLPYFRRMVDVVDVQQADVTRCGGITASCASAVCHAAQVPFSARSGAMQAAINRGFVPAISEAKPAPVIRATGATSRHPRAERPATCWLATPRNRAGWPHRSKGIGGRDGQCERRGPRAVDRSALPGALAGERGARPRRASARA